MKKTLSLFLCLIFVSCSSKPVLYPNSKLKSVGKEKSSTDIEKCMSESDKFLKSKKGKQILKGAARGSFVGAAMGVVSGLLFGDIKRAVTSGAIIGGTGGGAGAAITPDRLKRAYVNRCLKNKGYDVMGWD